MEPWSSSCGSFGISCKTEDGRLEPELVWLPPSDLRLLARNNADLIRAFTYMDPQVENALRNGGIAEITTIGRRSSQPHRIEIFFHHFDGEYFLSGRPGFKRDWLANLSSNPGFTLHLKRGIEADVPAVANLITDPDRRQEILYRARTESWGVDPARAERDMDHWVATAPLASFKPQNN